MRRFLFHKSWASLAPYRKRLSASRQPMQLGQRGNCLRRLAATLRLAAAVERLLASGLASKLAIAAGLAAKTLRLALARTVVVAIVIGGHTARLVGVALHRRWIRLVQIRCRYRQLHADHAFHLAQLACLFRVAQRDGYAVCTVATSTA